MTKKIHTDLEITGSLTVSGQPVTGGAGIPDTLLDAKGDLIVASAADTVARLPVGTDGQILAADSVEATGLKWVDAAANGASQNLIVAEGTFSAVTTITLDTIFSSDFDDYKVVFYISSGSATDSIMFRYRSSGVDEVGSVYTSGALYARSSSAFGATGPAGTTFQIASLYVGYTSSVQMDIAGPNRTNETISSWSSLQGTATNPYHNFLTGVINTTTAYDGIKIYSLASATITGFYRIYGVPKTLPGGGGSAADSDQNILAAQIFS